METLTVVLFLGIFLEETALLALPRFWPPPSFGDPGLDSVEDWLLERLGAAGTEGGMSGIETFGFVATGIRRTWPLYPPRSLVLQNHCQAMFRSGPYGVYPASRCADQNLSPTCMAGSHPASGTRALSLPLSNMLCFSSMNQSLTLLLNWSFVSDGRASTSIL